MKHLLRYQPLVAATGNSGQAEGKRAESDAGFPVPFQVWEICVALVASCAVVNVIVPM